MKDDVTLLDLQGLCKRFDIVFGINYNDKENLLIYSFGKVKWAITPDNKFTTHDYYEVSLRLAATLPDKVLEPIDSPLMELKMQIETVRQDKLHLKVNYETLFDKYTALVREYDALKLAGAQ